MHTLSRYRKASIVDTGNKLMHSRFDKKKKKRKDEFLFPLSIR